jgi:hypothetical protein
MLNNPEFNSKVFNMLGDLGKSGQKAFFNQESWHGDHFLTEGIFYEEVSQHGGEGEGNNYWVVYRFWNKADEAYVQFDGSYYSYDGSHYHSYFIVTPKEVQMTIYERF